MFIPLRPESLAILLIAFLFFCSLSSGLYAAQSHDVLCTDGSGNFEADFHTGVSVHVRASRAGALATRSCEAKLEWNKDSLTIATNVPRVDVDTFGADFELGVPVTTLQVQKAAADCCMEYRVYSLEKPPRLLWTITGGDFFSASDVDLDGRLEIWTHDAAAIEGFENLDIVELETAPTIVLRFEHGELVDASSEFQLYYDREIAQLRRELDSDSLRDFKNSDGKLSHTSSLRGEQVHYLKNAKAKVLRIVWAYLYSGREEQAWRVLDEMWPADDTSRIRTALVNARGHGIRAQVKDISKAHSDKRKKQVPIFDAIDRSTGGRLDVIPPVAIMLNRPPGGTPNESLAKAEVLLELVIDSAGKVRSAESVGKASSIDPALIEATNGWKFIPAFKSGRAVASRTHLAVALRQ